MRYLRSWLLRLAGAFGGGRGNEEILEELQMHRELLAAEFQRTGLQPDDANRRAALQFGSVSAVADAYQDRRSFPVLDQTFRDARMAMRSLSRTPMLSLSMVLVLGLGVGLSTAIAAVFHAIVWAGLPVPASQDVVRITRHSEDTSDRRVQGDMPAFAYPEVETYRKSTRAFAALAGVSHAPLTLRRGTDKRVIQAARVTGDYFAVLPVTPAIGRLLTPADARQPVAIISHRLWTETFGGEPGIVQQSTWLDSTSYHVVGVAPRSFSGTEVEPVDVWIPLETAALGDQKALNEPNMRSLKIFGRLASATRLDAAASEAALIASQLDRDYPGRRTALTLSEASRFDRSSADPRRSGRAGGIAMRIAVIVGVLFLICGSNAAALLLARGAARQKEIAVRLAIGAGRMHLVRQLLTEVSVIALASGVMGVLVCFAALRGLAGWLPMGDLLASVRPSAFVFIFAFGAAFVVALLFGLAPVRQALQVDCLGSLKGEATVLGGRMPALRLRRALIALQVTVSVVLLVAAGLLGRGAAQAWQTNPGYTTKGLYVVHPDANWEPGLRPADKGTAGAQLAAALTDAPGIRKVAMATVAPFFGTGSSEAASGASTPFEPANFNQVDDRYFATLGVSLTAGRMFLPHEENVVIVNAALAKRFWRDERAALDQTLYLAPSGGGNTLPRRAFRVIGVVPTLETTTIGIPDRPTYYTPLGETDARSAFLLVRADENTAVERLVIQRAQSADPDAFAFIGGLEARRMARTAPARLAVAIAGVIGLLALAVAAVGIHGVISYTVACRTHDIGVYRALGAQHIHVLRLILGWTMKGVAAGTVGAIVVMIVLLSVFDRPLRAQLNGAAPLDPTAFLLAMAVVLSVIAVATYWPARRALGMAPLTALRRE